MPRLYEFTVRDTDGRKLQGVLRAKSEMDLIRQLQLKGYTITAIKEKQSQASRYARKIPAKDVAIMCRQLSTTLRVGIPIIEGIKKISKESGNARLKSVLDQAVNDLSSGMTLSATFAKHTGSFPSLLVKMLQVAEASGNLEHVLHLLSDTFRKEYLIMKKIKGAFIYPVFVLSFALIVVNLLMIYTLPVFQNMFADADAALPWITKTLLYLQQFFARYGLFTVMGIILLFIALAKWFTTENGRRFRDYVLLHLPLVAKFVKKVETYRFSQTLRDLYASGIPIEKALQITSEVAGNKYFSEAISHARDAVRRGKQMSETLIQSPLFPDLLISMVKVGEETGELETLLQEVSEYMQNELEEEINQLVALIEPTLIILVGIMVAAMMAAIIIPMYDSMVL